MHTKKKVLLKSRAMRKHKNKAEGYGWEVIPFAIAILVSVVVIVQSMGAARDMPIQPRNNLEITTMHSAAPCNPTGAPLVELRVSERAYNRTLELLEDAQIQYDWDCSVDAQGKLCSNAKENLQRVNDLLGDQSEEFQAKRIEACL